MEPLQQQTEILKNMLSTFLSFRYQYVLGEKTWIEYWPTESECVEDSFQATCEGLDDLVFTFGFDGCRE